MLSRVLSLCPKIERERSVNNCMPCILKYEGVVRLSWSIIELSTAFLEKNAYDKIVTMSQNEPQRSVKDFWSCILQNLTAMERSIPTMNPSAARTRKNASDHIASPSYNWTPAVRQQVLWRLRTLHSNELHRAVPKSSFTQSVFAI